MDSGFKKYLENGGENDKKDEDQLLKQCICKNNYYFIFV